MKLGRFILNPPAGNWLSFRGPTSIVDGRIVPGKITRCYAHDARAPRLSAPLELVLDLHVDVFADELISTIAKRGSVGALIDVTHGSFPELASMAVSNGARFVHLQHGRTNLASALQFTAWLRKKHPRLNIVTEPRSTAELLELAVAGADHFATGNPWRLTRWLQLFKGKK